MISAHRVDWDKRFIKAAARSLLIPEVILSQCVQLEDTQSSVICRVKSSIAILFYKNIFNIDIVPNEEYITQQIPLSRFSYVLCLLEVRAEQSASMADSLASCGLFPAGSDTNASVNPLEMLPAKLK